MIIEKEKEDIRREAKVILDRFVNSLERIKIKGKRFKRESGCFREEKEGEKCDEDFRNRMFENAPETREDCIVAEKKRW